MNFFPFPLPTERASTGSRVFDWIKAAEILRDRRPRSAVAGLATDMAWTAGDIWKDGAPVTDRDDTYTYLASSWATPVLVLVFDEDDEDEIECWVRMNNADNPHGWDSGTLWPPEALAIVQPTTVVEPPRLEHTKDRHND